MGRKKKKNNENQNDPNVHKDLEGLEININPFGEIETNYDIQKINDFLNKHVEDKKLKEREELKKKGLAKDSPKPGKKDDEAASDEGSSGEDADEEDEGDDSGESANKDQ